MDTAAARSFILDSGALPPTVAAALAQSLDTIPPERLQWLLKLIQQAKEADENFGRTSQLFMKRVQALEAAAIRRGST